MKTWRSLHKAISVMALVFMATVLLGCPLKVKLEDDCKTSGGTTGEGLCVSHQYGRFGTDHQNFPTCTGGYVCNSPGATCVDAATGNSGKCKLNPNSGNCDCKCM